MVFHVDGEENLGGAYSTWYLINDYLVPLSVV